MNTQSNVSSYRPRNTKVSIQNNHGTIRLAFTWHRQRYFVNIGLQWCESHLEIAEQKVAQITNDIIYNRFDGDTDKYKVGYTSSPPTNNDQNVLNFPDLKPAFTLKDAWESYKVIKQQTVVESVQKSDWLWAEKIISLLEKENLLNIKDADNALRFLLKTYKHGSLQGAFSDFRAAINLAIDLDKYDGKNTYAALLKRWPESKKKDPEAFTKDEVNVIIDAFKTNRFHPPRSAYYSEYYAPLIEFRFWVSS